MKKYEDHRIIEKIPLNITEKLLENVEYLHNIKSYMGYKPIKINIEI